MRYLKPMIMHDSYYTDIEWTIGQIFDAAIYKPLREIFKKYGLELQNSEGDALYQAIRDGKIFYDGTHFKGQYNSAISKVLKKMGAKYSPFRKTWYFTETLPAMYQTAIAQADSRISAMIGDITSTLDKVDINAALSQHPLQAEYFHTINAMNDSYEDTIRSVSIPLKLTTEAKQIIAKEYSENLDLYIKDWADENILKLRKDVMQNVSGGLRAENLEKLIQSSYNSSKAKAKFLARQETSLLMSNLRETRYKESGITRYKWSTSHDGRVRDRRNPAVEEVVTTVS